MKKALPITATAIILWAVLAFMEKAFLLKNGNLSLFLLDWTFLRESFMTPGGFLGWAGSFFTQFLLIPWLGALLWVALLTAAGILTARTYNIPFRLAPLATIPVAILIIGNMSLGYGIYVLKMQDYFFAPTLGYLLMLLIINVTWNTQNTWKRMIWLAASAFAGYVLAGVFALAGVLAAGLGIISCTEEKESQSRKKLLGNISTSAVSIALAVVTPLILYSLYTRYRLIDSWFMGLPTTSEQSWEWSVRIPSMILMGFAIILAPLRFLFTRKNCSTKKMTIWSIGIASIVIGTVFIFWFKDENFKTELKMSEAVDRSDWEKVTDIYKKASMRHRTREKKAFGKMKKELTGVADDYSYDSVVNGFKDEFFEPTRLMVLLRDLALLKQGKALDQAFTMRNGGMNQNSKTQIPMTIQAGPQLYLNFGLINMAYRWCLEDNVEHGWNFSTLRYMAMHATIMNEPEFADKFLDKLDRTIFFHKWSRLQRPLSRDAGLMSECMPYKEIIPYMSYGDRMSTDGTMAESYILYHFTNDRGNQASPEFDEAALLFAMNSKDSRLFWKTLFEFLDTSDSDKLPKHVQEAALLFSSLENENLGIPFDKTVKDSFKSFQQNLNEAGYRSMEEAAYPFWERFGNTYYYYYYFVRDLRTF